MLVFSRSVQCYRSFNGYGEEMRLCCSMVSTRKGPARRWNALVANLHIPRDDTRMLTDLSVFCQFFLVILGWAGWLGLVCQFLYILDRDDGMIHRLQ